jgi:hypothetical protein
MSQRFWPHVVLAALLLFLGCGPKLRIPPKVDLTRYERVGLIGFCCNAEGNMHDYLTRRFLLALRSYQKEARIIELGSEEEVTKSVQAEEINPEAIRRIGRKYNVDVVITGNLKVIEVRPLFKLQRGGARPVAGKSQIRGTRASADVKAQATARLWETEQGGTFWMASAYGDQMVDQVTVISEQKVIFDAEDLYKAFWDLVNPMVKILCEDFKAKYVRAPSDSL